MSKPWHHWSALNDGHGEALHKTKEPERWKETNSKENGRLTEAERVKKIWGESYIFNTNRNIFNKNIKQD